MVMMTVVMLMLMKTTLLVAGDVGGADQRAVMVTREGHDSCS